VPETTGNYHSVTVNSKKKGNPLRTIVVTKGIKALYDYKRKVIAAYLFDVDEYTMKQSKEWVKKHKTSASQIQVMDNLFLANQVSEFYGDLRDKIIKRVEEL